jgi:hypothetical protein
MTTQKSFKRIVRTRMERTGESYTAARAALLAASDPSSNGTTPAPAFTISDEAIRRRTGRGWEEWLDLLDAWGAADRTHTEIARHVVDEYGVKGWDSQSVTVSYERARGMREVGENSDGFAVTATKTIAVPVGRLFDAFFDESLRPRWMPDGELGVRTVREAKSARFDWGDGATRVNVSFEGKGDAKSTVAVSHERLPDADTADRMKAYWRGRVAALKEVLER